MTPAAKEALKACNNGFCLNGGSSNAQCRECAERSTTLEGTVINVLKRMNAERQDKGWIYNWLLDALTNSATPHPSPEVEEAVEYFRNNNPSAFEENPRHEHVRHLKTLITAAKGK